MDDLDMYEGIQLKPIGSHALQKAGKKLCFIIGPIGAHKSDDRIHADKLLKLIIKPTFNTHFKLFKVERADQISSPGMIDSQVITHLIEADLVVADLSTRNANAFYELGIRHLLQKPVIHMFRRGDPPPADVAPYRGIEFSYENKWEIRDAKVALRKAVTDIFSESFQIENPVTRSAGFLRLVQARGRARGKVSTMLTESMLPLFELRDKLQALATKTDVVSMPSGSFKKLYDPMRHLEKDFNRIVIEISRLDYDL